MDKIVCKCGARTYEEHLKSGRPAHTFAQDKASRQVANIGTADETTDPDDDFDASDHAAFSRLARRALFSQR
ncbi:hypothetical protein ACFRQM_32900 [Streptomyces sp. NPDC056831]|uniref:hypothetical protein n=1 Tax=Streptomyces sp. NPDC056831 TaxID=3345954 RepID=UPI0036A08C3A